MVYFLDKQLEETYGFYVPMKKTNGVYCFDPS